MKSYKEFETTLTPEQIRISDEMMKDIKKTIPEVLRDLVWEGGEMFYVDKEGNRTDKPVDLKSVTKELKAGLPKTPFKVNDKEADREELLDAEIAKIESK